MKKMKQIFTNILIGFAIGVIFFNIGDLISGKSRENKQEQIIYRAMRASFVNGYVTAGSRLLKERIDPELFLIYLEKDSVKFNKQFLKLTQ